MRAREMDISKLKSTEDKVLKSFEEAPRSQLWVAFKYLANVLNVRLNQVDLDYEIASAFRKEAKTNE
jgi:hypothetical protein